MRKFCIPVNSGSHDHTARLQLPNYPGQELPGQLLNLVLRLLLVLLLLMMLLLLAIVLLLAMLLLITTRIPTASVVPALVTARLLR